MDGSVVVFGSLNSDFILKVDRLPEMGETMPAQDVTIVAGGKGADQAVQAAKLGADTHLVGAVGTDIMGDFMIGEARKYGLDTSTIRRSDRSTGMSVVHALPGGRLYATINRGANFDLTTDDVDKNIDLIKQASVIIIQNEIPSKVNKYVIEKAKEYGCKIYYNAAPAEKMEKRYMAMCDVIIVNEVEAAFYTGKQITDVETAVRAGKEVAEEYGNSWVITLGELGSVIISGGRTEVIPSYKVDAVETTGAGDAYIGALAYAELNGMDLFEGGRFATKCSAYTVCGVGAQASMPTMEQLNNFKI